MMNQQNKSGKEIDAIVNGFAFTCIGCDGIYFQHEKKYFTPGKLIEGFQRKRICLKCYERALSYLN